MKYSEEKLAAIGAFMMEERNEIKNSLCLLPSEKERRLDILEQYRQDVIKEAKKEWQLLSLSL